MARAFYRGLPMSKHLPTILHLLGSALVVALTGSSHAETRQEHVHQMAHEVMPFELAKTVHIFKMTEFGGIQQVIARDPGAADQIALIRQHLQQQARRFQEGDFSDPAKLHGADMPGIRDLQSGSAHLEVSYARIPGGAEISFRTTDLRLITALHRWFGAQLSEHGADARAD